MQFGRLVSTLRRRVLALLAVVFVFLAAPSTRGIKKCRRPVEGAPLTATRRAHGGGNAEWGAGSGLNSTQRMTRVGAAQVQHAASHSSAAASRCGNFVMIEALCSPCISVCQWLGPPRHLNHRPFPAGCGGWWRSETPSRSSS